MHCSRFQLAAFRGCSTPDVVRPETTRALVTAPIRPGAQATSLCFLVPGAAITGARIKASGSYGQALMAGTRRAGKRSASLS
jgi:hypothetical protein